MPKSLTVLTKEMGAVVLNGFHVVGGKSPANLSPLLTGKAASELPDIDQFYFADHLDPAMFIFDGMKQDGYRTAFYKDMPWRGTFLNYHKGFSHQPADHYLCPFLMKHYVDSLKSNGNIFCIGDLPHYNVMLNLTKQLFELNGKKFSLTYITDISHEKFGIVSSIDDDVANYLRWFLYTRKLDNTVIIVMSDHGMRFGPQRATELGRIEERLPFLSIVLPKTVQTLRPAALLNLKSNVNVLTTTYDVYDTILDIVELDTYRSNCTVSGAKILRGMSLLEPIPKNRSCYEADIAPYWCVCNEWKAVSRNETIYRKVVSQLVEHVNGVIKQFPTLCSKRDLLHVEWVKRSNPKHMTYLSKHFNVTNKIKPLKQYREPYFDYYQVKIVMGPKPAVYEGAVTYSVETDSLTINENDVTRVNM
ncbi:hypothetical protein K1T71_013997 [Dendrolimus kikuchii]|uniref:Uncharacterized protein n=1 Tax=Dendrolimus kikuchii TaxID=765133 RepID=A0ACC1CGC8_9NEOP|nr:hypothetical protein K1T71_013997 [Dendrolimus kikuchii]